MKCLKQDSRFVFVADERINNYLSSAN